MPASRLSALQIRVLSVLAEGASGWVLTGGGALAGFHLGHRSTRDLDLFWHDRSELDEALRTEVRRLLRQSGLVVDVIQSSPAFMRLQVADAEEAVIVDLVAEQVPSVETPRAFEVVPGRSLLVDTEHEILVNELCALVHRSELRDLVDTAALMERGGDLERALRDAPRKDTGFSPVVLAWTLRQMPLERMVRAAGSAPAQATELEEFRSRLVERLARLTDPRS